MDPAAAAGPPLLVVRGAGAEAERGDVVAQRVPPNVDDLAWVAGNRDAPAVRAFGGPGDGEVFQAARDEAENLVTPLGWLDPQLAAADHVVELAGVTGEAKEPVLLRHLLRDDAVL